MAPDWLQLQPVRSPVDGTAYADIMSHVRTPSTKFFVLGQWTSNVSKETLSHENTHQINVELRNALRGKPSFYCLKGRYISLTEPGFKKSTTIKYIPGALRQTSTFQTYLIDPLYPTNALYLLDEYSAYMNCSEAGMDLEDQGEQIPDSTESVKDAVIFTAFATAIVRTVDHIDPDYVDKQRLREFVGWGLERTLNLAERAKKHPNFHAGDLESYVQVLKETCIQSDQRKDHAVGAEESASAR